MHKLSVNQMNIYYKFVFNDYISKEPKRLVKKKNRKKNKNPALQKSM